MGRSRYLNVDCARSQEAYFAKVRNAIHACLEGEADVECPRDTCTEHVKTSLDGSNVLLRCQACGLIYRGNLERLLSHFEAEDLQAVRT